MTTAAKDDTLVIERIETPPFGTNAYRLICRDTDESVLIDAPGEAEIMLSRLHGKRPQLILMTHSHMDHTGALVQLQSSLDVSLAAHKEDAARLPVFPDVLLQHESEVTVGNVTLKVQHTPGHTPGSLCFFTGKYLLSGDTLFPGGPGKTGTPSAFQQIIRSIKERLFVLPDDVQVFPGHGEPTVLGKEKEQFAVFASRSHPSDLCGDVLWLSS